MPDERACRQRQRQIVACMSQGSLSEEPPKTARPVRGRRLGLFTAALLVFSLPIFFGIALPFLHGVWTYFLAGPLSQAQVAASQARARQAAPASPAAEPPAAGARQHAAASKPAGANSTLAPAGGGGGRAPRSVESAGLRPSRPQRADTMPLQYRPPIVVRPTEKHTATVIMLRECGARDRRAAGGCLQLCCSPARPTCCVSVAGRRPPPFRRAGSGPTAARRAAALLAQRPLRPRRPHAPASSAPQTASGTRGMAGLPSAASLRRRCLTSSSSSPTPQTCARGAATRSRLRAPRRRLLLRRRPGSWLGPPLRVRACAGARLSAPQPRPPFSRQPRASLLPHLRARIPHAAPHHN
jgi:hypothetical protein